jgi:hypothetical protein
MFQTLILKEYNINIINLNYLLTNNIEIDIANFLYNNNLKLKSNSRDLNKIIIHFINAEIIKHLNENYNNILLFNNNYNLITLHHLFEEENIKNIINKNITKSIKNFNYSFFEITDNFVIDKNNIYILKQIIETKNNINYKKLKEFCEKFNLQSISSKLRENTRIKQLLHK